MIDLDEVEKRLKVWDIASNLAEPIVNIHGLERLRSGELFRTSYISTEVDQHLSAIIQVADWLIGKGD